MTHLEQLKEKYNEMWNKGKFNWNEGIFAKINPERIWNVFIEPQLTEATTTAKRETLRDVIQKLKDEKDGYLIDDIITHLESELSI